MRVNRAVNVDAIQLNETPLHVTITGSVLATRRMAIVSEVPGQLMPDQPELREGMNVTPGQTLLRIDDRELRLNLIAQRSALISLLTQQLADLALDHSAALKKWEDYIGRCDERQPLPDLPEVIDQKEKRFISARGIYNQFYAIRSAEARLEKFTAKAPFGGSISKGNITPGAQVMVGQQLAELIDPNSFELETAIPSALAKMVKVGTKALFDNGAEGVLVRVSDRMDPRTQSVTVFLRMSGQDLKDGMALSGRFNVGNASAAVALKRYQLGQENTVLIVKPDSTLALLNVVPVHTDGDEVVVTGLENGMLVVRHPSADLQPGLKITPLR